MNNIYSTPIIIVDRDLEFIDEIKQLLIPKGFQNILISKPNIVSALIKKEPIPYLIIMEYQFDDIDGSKLIESIKSSCREASVIVVSKTKNIIDGFNCLKKGATFFFRKDEIRSSPEILLKSVRTSLEFNNKNTLLKKQIDTMYESAIMCL
jgi:DNA-binding NtrC family response regulator